MTAPGSSTVWLVDDDPDLRRSIEWALRSVGLAVETYADARDFLARATPGLRGCLLTDVRMPGMSGLELLEALAARDALPAAVVMTQHGDAPTAVRAMKAGAFDFLEKPFREQALIDVVHRALLHGEKTARRRERVRAARAALAALSPREREVFEAVADGHMNKEIARALNLSVRTVELHRAHLMDKLGVANVSGIVTLRLLAGRDDD